MAAWQLAGLPAWQIAQSRDPADRLIADAVYNRIVAREQQAASLTEGVAYG